MSDLSMSINAVPASLWQINSLATGQKISSVSSTGQIKDESAKVKAACQEFESLFLNYLLKEMRATIPKSGFLDGAQAEKIYTAMYDEQLSMELSRHGGIGLAKILEEKILEGQNTSTDTQAPNSKIE